MVSLFSPLRSLDADHAQVLREVRQLTAEASVLKNRSDVVPVVFCYTASDSQVVRLTWWTEKEFSSNRTAFSSDGQQNNR